MKGFSALVLLGLVSAVLSAPALDSSLLRTLQVKKNAEILISFRNANVENVRSNAVAKARGGPRAAVIESMYKALTAHAEATQANVLKMLEKHRSADQMKVFPFWITNQIGIKGADMDVVQSLMTMDEISEIIEAPVGGLITPVSMEELPANYVHADEQWGIQNIEAPAVWATGDKGKGVTVGSLDTGAKPSHEALRDNFRAENGWYDPAEGDMTPTDGHGHGTHTIGTMVGNKNGIGVAPEAQFIACKGMDRFGSGSAINFIACGQFFVAPTESDGKTNPRFDLAPVAVGNSWGYAYGSNFGFFDEVMKSWIDAGIAPVVAAGNEGNGCETLRTPGNSPLAISIGATDPNNKITYFSSAGPNKDGVRRPTVSAPGLDTISASISSDTGYTSMSGTSMATPHVVGLIGLLHNKRSGLTVAQVESVLTTGSQRTTHLNKVCGGISDTEYPNNHVGHGKVNARISVENLLRL